MAYERIMETPIIDRIQSASRKFGTGVAADQIDKAKPGIEQRRGLFYDFLNDSRFDGKLTKQVASSVL